MHFLSNNLLTNFSTVYKLCDAMKHPDKDFPTIADLQEVQKSPLGKSLS